MGLYSVSSILKDAKYDLTTNVSVVDGMTDGAECIVKTVDKPSTRFNKTKYHLGFIPRRTHWKRLSQRIFSSLQPKYR